MSQPLTVYVGPAWGGLPPSFSRGRSLQARQADVEQDDVGAHADGEPHGGVAVGGDVDFMSRRPEHPRKGFSGVGVVVHDEDAKGSKNYKVPAAR